MTKVEYIYCACGSTYHPDYRVEMESHIARSPGHFELNPREVRMYIEHVCPVCDMERGSNAYGHLMVDEARSLILSKWVCKVCLGLVLVT